MIVFDELIWNLKHLCDLYFVDGSTCNCYGQLVSFITELYDKLKDCEYTYIEGMMDGKVHSYMTESYRKDMILKVRKHLRYDENTNTFIATSRQELLEYLKEVNISEMTFRTHIQRMGYDLAYETVTSRSTKGKCIKDYTIIDNRVVIPKEEVTNAIKVFCSRYEIEIDRI